MLPFWDLKNAPEFGFDETNTCFELSSFSFVTSGSPSLATHTEYSLLFAISTKLWKVSPLRNTGDLNVNLVEADASGDIITLSGSKVTLENGYISVAEGVPLIVGLNSTVTGKFLSPS